MSETSVKESKKSKVRSAVCYIIGSAALYVGAFTVIPNAKKSEDDWGAVIEKKHPENNDKEE